MRPVRRRHREWRGTYAPPGLDPIPGGGTDEALVCDYGPAGVSRDDIVTADELGALPAAAGGRTGAVRLVVITGVEVGPAALAVVDSLNLNSLEREDVLSDGHQVKIAALESSRAAGDGFLALLPFAVVDGEQVVHTRLALVQRGSTVVVLQETELAPVASVVARIRDGAGRVRQMSANYLAYLMIDGVADAGSSVSALLLDRLEDVEERILEGHTGRALFREVQDLRLLSVWARRTVAGLRDELAAELGPGEGVFEAAVRPYASDCLEHASMVQDGLESRREQAASLVPLYTAISGAAMNEVMKTLTIIATIFIPLTFIAGIYGMNFATMPELAWRWGYPAVLLVMAIVAGGMIWYFRRRRWM